MTLIGRHDELDALERWLEQKAHATLVIHGEPGVGKSALLGAWLADHPEVVRLELDRVERPAEVAARLHEALGDRGLDGDLVEDRMRAAGQGVLALDDADEVLERLGELLEHWRQEAPGWRVVLTARARPRELARAKTQHLALAPLTTTQAHELLARGCPPGALEEATPAERDVLVALLDGNPLAITLAARRCALMSPGELLERLRTRQHALGGGAGRFSSLEEALELSWRQLDPTRRRVLGGALSFARAFSLEAAEAVLGPSAGSSEALLDTLQTLRERGLLRRVSTRPTRLMLSRALRPLLERRADDDELAAARDRHAEHFATLAGELADRAPADPAWRGRLRACLDDLVLAHRRLPEDEQLARLFSRVLSRRSATTSWLSTPERLARLSPRAEAEALRDDALELLDRSHAAAARARLSQAIERLGGERAHVDLEAQLRVALLKLDTRSGDLESAALQSDALWKLERRRGAVRATAKSCWHSARLYQRLGRDATARERLTQLLELEFDEADERMRALGRQARMMLAELLPPTQSARKEELASQLLVEARRLERDALAGRACALLADLAAARRAFSEAGSLYAQARPLSGDPEELRLRHHDAQLAAGEEPPSLEGLGSAGALARRALLALRAGQLEEAAAVARQATAAASDDDALAHTAMALAELAVGLREDSERALPTLEALCGRHDGPAGRAITTCAALLRGEDPPEAPARWQPSSRVSDLFGDLLARLDELELLEEEDAHEQLQLSARARAHEALIVEPGARAYLIPQGQRCELGRKMLLRRLLEALVIGRLERPGRALTPEELLAAGWPDEPHIQPDAARNRLRVAIRRLRDSGLEGLLLTDEQGGYLLDPDVPVERAPEPE